MNKKFLVLGILILILLSSGCFSFGEERRIPIQDLTGYAYLNGRNGGQRLIGGLSSVTDYLILGGNTSGGYVGINKNNPLYPLDIEGDINSSNFRTQRGNVLIGFDAGRPETNSNYRTCVGYDSCRTSSGVGLTSATCIGYDSCRQSYSTQIIGIGHNANQVSSGIYSIGLGNSALQLNSANYIIGIGSNSGYQSSGSNSTFIGCQAGMYNSGADLVAIGWNAGKNNVYKSRFILKQGSVNPNALIEGNFSSGMVIFPNYGAGTLQTDAFGNISAVSNLKYKKDITSYTKGIKAVIDTNPITYRYNEKSGLDTLNYYTGFSAENLKKSIPESVFSKPEFTYENVFKNDSYIKCVNESCLTIPTEYELKEIPILDENGYQAYTYTISDRVLIATLFNAVKEQQKEIDELKGRCKT